MKKGGILRGGGEGLMNALSLIVARSEEKTR